jgi:hypothetical protein
MRDWAKIYWPVLMIGVCFPFAFGAFAIVYAIFIEAETGLMWMTAYSIGSAIASIGATIVAIVSNRREMRRREEHFAHAAREFTASMNEVAQLHGVVLDAVEVTEDGVRIEGGSPLGRKLH